MLLCHDVYFTLKDRSPAAVDALVAACKKYLTVQPGIVFFCCGKLEPELAREVNDRGFDVALHVVFTDRAAHDAYQSDDMHNRFIAEMKPNWAKVRVFDSLVERV
jgi:Stress responsive A/B Barrel Domain